MLIEPLDQHLIIEVSPVRAQQASDARWPLTPTGRLQEVSIVHQSRLVGELGVCAGALAPWS